MADIVITGQKKLKTISDEFQKNFSYLFLAFFSGSEQKKADGGKGGIIALPSDKTLASVRTVTPKTSKEISIHGRTKVSTLEKNFRDEYGVNAQVCFGDGKKLYYTSGDMDDMSLTQLNNLLKDQGYKEKPKF